MIESLPELVNGDEALTRRGRWLSADMAVEIGDEAHVIEIRNGRIEAVWPVTLAMARWDFAIRGTAEAWTEFWKPRPRPRHHDLIALMREGKMRLEGNLDLLMANLLYVKLVLETPRRLSGGGE